MSESKTKQTDNPEPPKSPVELPVWQWAMIHDYVNTVDELLSLRVLSLGLSPRVHKLVKRRVEGMEANGIRVPQDYKNLKDAVKLVNTGFVNTRKYGANFVGNFSKIIVGAGVHKIDGDLRISSAVDIVGDPGVSRDKIVIEGGIVIMEGIQGNCHLQHLTVRQAKECGVWGFSSFTMEDVLVDKCGHGVWANGVVGRCANVEVRDCIYSGVVAAFGASITLVDKTTVYNNCTNLGRDDYGLKVFRSSSTIQLVSPLTKETVSKNNGGGGNWGAFLGADINEIKNIEAPSGETKHETTDNTLRFF
tara:strand:+ start:1298 stop:2212 length:915 start_codon:yes stop_codon:yes gene_type:complete